MINHAEKRDFMRMFIDCSLSLTTTDSSKNFQGHMINLSNEGLLFTSNQKFEVGTILNIVLTPRHSETPPVHATVIVARVSSNELSYEVACKIRDIDSQPAL